MLAIRRFSIQKSTCNMLRYASGYRSLVKRTASAWTYSAYLTSADLKSHALRQMKLYSSSSSMKDESDQNLFEYERKTPLEHILLRPGMYIGQTTLSTSECWTMNNNVMERRKLTFSPGLYKIFDEILVNAADNLNRVPKSSKLQMTRIDVTVDVIVPKNNKRKGSPGHLKVSIKNDGRAIPINMHPKENMHIPELIFGHLLTGTNFNDNSSRLTGGSHGYGAKLTNIFSNSFEVEIFDAAASTLYSQNWSDNMSRSSPPIIIEKKTLKSEKNYTKITFEPDLSKFQGFGSDETDHSAIFADIVNLFHRRTVDIAGCLPEKVGVYFNGAKIPVSNFKDYANMFAAKPLLPHTTADGTAQPPGAIYCKVGLISSTVNDRLEVAILPSLSGSFDNVSFVNNVWTSRGGSHLNIVTSQVVFAIEEAILKKDVKLPSTAIIKNKLLVLVNALIENPSFEGQTKDALITKTTQITTPFQLPKEFLNEVVKKSGIVEWVVAELKSAENSKLVTSVVSKKSRKLVLEIPKLEDAHLAGTDRALECTLILTEGDSAKALAIAGLEVVGRDKFGVFPLKGKILNVRMATRSQISKNEEIINLCKAIGLDYSKSYSDGLENKDLRYGKIMLMCDQDNDGSHIKGLIINFFHFFWPHLLSIEGFLQQFITPIVKVRSISSDSNRSDLDLYRAAETDAVPSAKKSRKKKGVPKASETSKQQVLEFYSGPEYLRWRNELLKSRSDDSVEDVFAKKKLVVKYYKGLGTNTAKEGREYFQNLDKHRKIFTYHDENEDVHGSGQSDDRNYLTLGDKESRQHDLIDMAFSKERVNDRRNWLTNIYEPDDFINPTKPTVSFDDFVNKELIMFSTADNLRSIPSVVDGLKPSQRKVLFGCFRKNLSEESKVVQIAGYIAEQTAYHHGEASLHATIVHMAQDFVGSNNIPLLEPLGQFGTRATGGKDYASPRYIYTRLSPMARAIFPALDDVLLDHLEVDAQLVEPKYFIPVIPFLLVNGAQGIGTGWSTKIPPYNLPDIIEHIEMKVRGVAPKKSLAPFVRGFTGSITAQSTTSKNIVSSYVTTGNITRSSRTTVDITELPYGEWTEAYKTTLCDMVEVGAIKSFTENHSFTKVHFIVSATQQALDEMDEKGLAESFKLSANISMLNMHAFDKSGSMKRYLRPEDIIEEYYPVRYQCYSDRKVMLSRRYEADLLENKTKSDFINCIISGDIDLRGVRETDLLSELRRKGFANRLQIDSIRQAGLRSGQHSAVSTAVGKTSSDANDNSGGVENGQSGLGGYQYLLNMPIQSFTDEQVRLLSQRMHSAQQKLEDIHRKTETDLWMEDLSALRNKYLELFGR